MKALGMLRRMVEESESISFGNSGRVSASETEADDYECDANQGVNRNSDLWEGIEDDTIVTYQMEVTLSLTVILITNVTMKM